MSQKHVLTDLQNTPHFLIIGSGRLAHHFSHYFQQLHLSYQAWDRAQDIQLLTHHLNKATHILLAVSDRAIENVYNKYFNGHDKVVVHFSGALNIPAIAAAHPLMTFGPDLYELEFYRQIHFVISGGETSLQNLLPGLSNSFTVLKDSDKAFYHSLCVMGGNFPTILIQKMLGEFQQLNIPPEAARLYVEKIVANVLQNPERALTGPLARHDSATITKNLNALKQDPYQKIYAAFVETVWPQYFAEKKNEHS